jgi:hypothetical protein
MRGRQNPVVSHGGSKPKTFKGMYLFIIILTPLMVHRRGSAHLPAIRFLLLKSIGTGATVLC